MISFLTLVGWSAFWSGATVIHVRSLGAAAELTAWTAWEIVSSHTLVAVVLLGASLASWIHRGASRPTAPSAG